MLRKVNERGLQPNRLESFYVILSDGNLQKPTKINRFDRQHSNYSNFFGDFVEKS